MFVNSNELYNYCLGMDTAFSALYRVNAYEMSPDYDPSTYQGDIALVQVDKINFNENVGPICLPFRYSFNTFEGDNVTALGEPFKTQLFQRNTHHYYFFKGGDS